MSTQQSDASSSDKESASLDPLANLNEKGLDMERSDAFDKDTWEDPELEEGEISSEPPCKRQKMLESGGAVCPFAHQAESAPDADDDAGEDGADLDEDNQEQEDSGTHHEFEIIDEIAEGEDDQEEEGEGDSDDSLDDAELYALLEEGITKDSITPSDQPIEREKVVLVGMYIFMSFHSPEHSFCENNFDIKISRCSCYKQVVLFFFNLFSCKSICSQLVLSWLI